MILPNCRFAIVAATLLSPLYWGGIAAGLEVPVQNDAQVQQASPNANFGSNGNLCVHSTSTALRYSYIKFDPASYMPPGLGAAQVAHAVLYLYPNAVSTAGSIGVYSVLSAWGEGKASGTASSGDISWSFQPANNGAALATITLGTANVDDFVALDVTSIVQNWISNPSQNYGLLLKPINSAVINFDAKETVDTSHGPKLDITLTGPAGTNGATWLSGSAAPASNVGANGDYYLNTVTKDYYVKTNGAWTATGSLNGAKWLSGNGAPANTVGSDGDFYLDTFNSAYYGPKSGGQWVQNGLSGGTSIKGATGPQGPATIRIQPGGDLLMGAFHSGPMP